jgi:fructokinase
LSPGPTRTLCLGDALVDLVGERSGRALAEIDRFSPHFGGVAATVALVAARAGAPVALAGGAGDDGWGRWLLAQLRDAGVDVSLFKPIAEFQTPIAFVTVSADGEPSTARARRLSPSGRRGRARRSGRGSGTRVPAVGCD